MVKKIPNFRWVVIALLFLMTIINYLDRSAMGYAASAITQEFHFSKNQLGLILGAFGIGYVVTAFLGGIAADHFGAKKTLLISISIWGVVSFLTALSTSLLMLIGVRVLLGLAEGPSFPALTRAASDWLSEKERNRAMAWTLISVPLALAIGGPLISELLAFFSWQGAYFILGVSAFLWLPCWWWLFTNQPQSSPWVSAEELALIQKDQTIVSALATESNPWKTLFFNRTLLANNWAFFVFGYYLFFFMTWLPSYLSTQHHLDITQVGWFSMLPWLLAATFIWALGTLADKIFKKTKNLRLSRTYPILISQLLSAIFIIPIIFATHLLTALVCITLAVAFAMSANASFYTVNIDIAKERAGSALGVMEILFALSGFIAPALTGYIITITGQYASAFWLLTALACSSVIILFLFHNKNVK